MMKKKNTRDFNDLQLLYMWIRGKEEDKLKGTEYRFTSEFNIQFNPKKINDEGVIFFELKITKSPNYIPYFFGKNIQNLTTIVGNNGSGKTELLKEICRYDTKNFFLFFDGGQYLWFGNYSILNKNDDLRQINKIPNNLKNFYYYSPSYIGNKLKGIIGLVDFSINRIAGDDFQTDESLSQIKFLSSKEGKKMFRLLKFKNEVVANVNIIKYHDKALIKKDLSSLVIICTSLHRHSYLLYEESNRNKDSNVRLLHYLFFLETITLIKAFKIFEESTQEKFVTQLNEMESEWRNIAKEKLNHLDYLINILGKNLLSGLTTGNLHANRYRREMVDKITKTRASLLFYKKYFSKENKEFKQVSIDGRGYYNFSASMSDKDSIELLNCIKNINFFESRHALIHWSYMSYGQRTFLNLFSLLYPIVIKSRSMLRLMIDEGELGFHPEWQRNYINILMSFFNSSIINSKIQLILTTHSPLILSDIPINNIIFLKKNETPFEGKQTFSQNIHTILYDSFFLNKSGTIGAFAKRKIRMLISRITGMQKNQEKNTEIEKAISIIGEPILRKAVEDMYFEKLSNASKKEKLLQQLRQLEEEEQMQND